jgi:hypothetical protein
MLQLPNTRYVCGTSAATPVQYHGEVYQLAVIWPHWMDL